MKMESVSSETMYTHVEVIKHTRIGKQGPGKQLFR